MAFVAVRSSLGKRFVEVPEQLATDATDMVKAMGSPSHYARGASAAALASGAISPDELRHDLELSKKDNVAKHGPGRGGRVPSSAFARVVLQDPLQMVDPWAAYLAPPPRR